MEGKMRLYEVQETTSEAKTRLEILVDSGYHFKSFADFKANARKNPKIWDGKILELHSETLHRITPKAQTRLTFEVTDEKE